MEGQLQPQGQDFGSKAADVARLAYRVTWGVAVLTWMVSAAAIKVIQYREARDQAAARKAS